MPTPAFLAEGKTLPGGLVLLPVPFGGALEIRDASGTRVFEGTARDGLVDFRTPLREGRYKLTHERQGCGDPTTERTFEVGSAVPLPTSAGEVKNGGVTQVPARAGDDSVGACDRYGSPRLASVDVWLAPSAELTPYVPLAKFEVVVDGIVMALPRYTSEVGPAVARTTLTTTCEAPPTGWQQADYLVSAGRHQIEIRGQLADGKKLPIASGDVDIVCGPPPGDAAAGCNASPRSGTSTFGAFALVAMIGLAARRRRR